MLQNRTVRVILGGVTLIGLSYLTYRFWKTYKKPQNNTRKVSQESHDEHRLRTVHSNYSQFYFDKEEELKKVVGLVSEKGPTVEQTYLLSPIILVDEYLKYTLQIRKRRRLIRKINQDQYISLVRNYEFEVKQLLQRGREELLEEFGRSPDDLERMQSAFQMFDDLQGLRKKAQTQLQQRAFPTQKARRIPASKLRRIIEEEINFINNRMYERIKLKLQGDQMGITQEQIYRILATLIDDIIYQKYGYEREDIQYQLNQMPILDKELKRSRKILFAQIGNFNLDSLESPDEAESEQLQQENKQSISDRTHIMQDSTTGE